MSPLASIWGYHLAERGLYIGTWLMWVLVQHFGTTTMRIRPNNVVSECDHLFLLRFSFAACFFHLEDMLVEGAGSAFWRNSNVYKTYYQRVVSECDTLFRFPLLSVSKTRSPALSSQVRTVSTFLPDTRGQWRLSGVAQVHSAVT
jgi:hypothetical protein